MSANENELQRLEHDQTYHVKKAGLWGYDASSGGLRMVSVNEDGSIPTTGGGAVTSYNYIQSEADATYKYYGYASATGWKFKRKTLSSGVWKVASGTGDYDTAWADKANKSYLYA